MKQRLNKICYLHELFEDWIMFKLYNKNSAHTLKDREPVIFTKPVSFFCEKNGVFYCGIHKKYINILCKIMNAFIVPLWAGLAYSV